MNTSANTSLRVNVYAEKSELITELHKHLQAVDVVVAGIKGRSKSFFTDPDYIICSGIGRDANKALKQALQTNSKLIILLPLVTDKPKNSQAFIKYINKLPKTLKCKIIWVGDNGQGFRWNFNQAFKDYYLINPHDAAVVIGRAMFSFWGEITELTITDKIPQEALMEYSNPKSKKKVFQSTIRGKLLTPGVDTVSRIFVSKVVYQPVIFPMPVRSSMSKRKKIIILLFILILILLTPLILLASSLGLGYLGYKNLYTNPYQAQRLFSRSVSLAGFSGRILPIKQTQLLTQIFVIGEDMAKVVILNMELQQGIMGKQEFDINSLSEKLKLNLEKLYTDSSFLESEVGDMSLFAKQIPSRELIAASRDIASELPLLLGGEGKIKTYMVLIQDNKELRPTGGLINSVVLVSFQNGKLIDTQDLRVENLDAQLRGQIDPPTPIKTILGQTSWKLVDSNWDPDFPESAQRAMWFLDKSIDTPVDGVIAVVGRDIWESLKNLKLNPVDLENKNVQLYFNDKTVQNIISRLGWGGEVAPKEGVWLGLVEANLGNNQANANLTRSSDLSIDLDGTTAKYSLKVNLVTKEAYKGYLRVLTPPGASFAQVQIMDQGKTIKSVAPQIFGREAVVEAGVFVEVPANGEREVVFSFTRALKLDLNTSGEVEFYLRKQAGLEENPTNIDIRLTNGHTYGYNTNLEFDFSTKITW